MITKYVVWLLLILISITGCKTVPREYSYKSGEPEWSIRNSEWEGFGVAPVNPSTTRRYINYSYLEDKPRVLVIIADTYGNPDEMDQEWLNKVNWFFDDNRLTFVQPDNSPNRSQHWHGFGCYSRMWPLLYGIPNIDFVLFRMIDVPQGEYALLDFIKENLETYNGRVVVSNSWGSPRQNNSFDGIIRSIWMPWANEIDRLSEEYPAFTVVFSAGNSAPDWSGFPQSITTNAVIVGASERSGSIADFSCRDLNMFGVAGGHKVFVANPDAAGRYMIASGTSFSSPTVAAMITRLMAKNPEWDRHTTINYLKNYIVQSPDEDSDFNVVWGYGEIEQYNQLVPENIWRELHFPRGFIARTRGMFTPSRVIDLPEPLLPINEPMTK